MISKKLNKIEIKILTLINETRVDLFEQIVFSYLKISSKKLAQIINKLKKLELIYIMNLYDEVYIYMHSKKVTSDLIDEDLRALSELGEERLNIFRKNSKPTRYNKYDIV